MADEPVLGPMFIPTQANKPVPHITLFHDAGLRGDALEITGEACAYVGDAFNDQASSLVVFSGIWRLYQNIDFDHGTHGAGEQPVDAYIEVGPGTYNYIGDIYFAGTRAGDHWNDSLTSLEPIAYTDMQLNEEQVNVFRQYHSSSFSFQKAKAAQAKM